MNNIIFKRLTNIVVGAVIITSANYNIAFANDIVVADQNTNITSSTTGVTIVNIADTTNGISHNKFTDFNVNTKGVILNNSNTVRTDNSLISFEVINPNANLKNGTASIIINEVVGNKASVINGNVEVYGATAAYILANPNGITYNGGVFINTSRLTLATAAVEVNGAVINLNLNNQAKLQLNTDLRTNAATLIARYITIAKSLDITGALNIVSTDGTVRYDTLAINPTTQEYPYTNNIAIDASALGSMVAGTINIVATGLGFGVNLDSKLIQTNTGNLRVSVNSNVNLNNTNTSVVAKTGLIIDAVAGYINNNATLNGVTVTLASNNGILNYKNITASGTLSLSGYIYNDKLANLYGNVVNLNSGIPISNVSQKPDLLENFGNIVSNTTLNFGSVGNAARSYGINNSGLLRSTGTMLLEVVDLTNTGTIESYNGSIVLAGERSSGSLYYLNTLENLGTIRSSTLVQFVAKDFINNGLVESRSIYIDGRDSFTNTGKILSSLKNTITGLAETSLETRGDFLNTGEITLIGATDIYAENLLVNTGTINIKASATLNNDVNIIGGRFVNAGTIQSLGSLNLTTNDLINEEKALIKTTLGSLFIDAYNSFLNIGGVSAGNILNITTDNYTLQSTNNVVSTYTTQKCSYAVTLSACIHKYRITTVHTVVTPTPTSAFAVAGNVFILNNAVQTQK
jgi:filamentous hemagglutinin